MFTRVLIANRGEVAVRVIRALHELGVEAVAVYSTADAGALHTRLADRAVCVGPAARRRELPADPLDHRRRDDDALRRRPPGLGLPGREPGLRRGLPRQRARLRRPERRDDGPNGRQGASRSTSWPPPAFRSCPAPTARRRSTRPAPRPKRPAIPVLLKAVAGGGGKGMRLVAGARRARRSVPDGRGRGRGRVRRPAASTSRRRSCRRGTSRSRCSPTAQGGVLTLGERECSIQRRHQKLIEESPSPALTPETREQMEDAAERAVPRDRLPERGHLRVPARPGRLVLLHRAERAAPGRASGERARDRASTSSASSCGSRPASSLAATGRAPSGAGTRSRCGSTRRTPRGTSCPMPGRIERFRPPLGPGVRVDTHIEDGAVIPPNYDSLLAKVIVWDTDRPAAIDRCLRALAELEVVGVPTTAGRCDRRPAHRGVRERALLDRASWRRRARACPRSAADERASSGPAHGALPSLPVGRDRPAARARSTRARSTRSRASSQRRSAARRRARREDHRGRPRSWTADRLGALERNVLRIGDPRARAGEVPVEVAIDEAVTLAKRYASDEAGRLVNGILGRIAREKAA